MAALEEYKEAYGYYPIPGSGSSPGTVIQLTDSFLDSCMGSIEKYDGVDPSNVLWRSKYGASATDGTYMVDPYFEPYYYVYPGVMNEGKFDLWSAGPDMVHGDLDLHGDDDAFGVDTVAKHYEKAQTRDENDD